MEAAVLERERVRGRGGGQRLRVLLQSNAASSVGLLEVEAFAS
ncbi:hypothetical protein [Dactylosporangium matsuzakiense]|nr:hypothetical protein [Dactylosporangium matsuzakiense]